MAVKKKKVNLSVGRGEKRSVKQGAGLTAKGRAKYNRATGSKLKAPVTGKVKKGSAAAKRRKSTQSSLGEAERCAAQNRSASATTSLWSLTTK